MSRIEVLLAILTAARGVPLSPVQLQKAAFLVTENLPSLLSPASRFTFVPYDYGPFDPSVYHEAELASQQGLVAISFARSGRWKEYAATASGLTAGTRVLDQLAPPARAYIINVTSWVLGQSFQGLVKSIYEAYPHMRENSIFSY